MSYPQIVIEEGKVAPKAVSVQERQLIHRREGWLSHHAICLNGDSRHKFQRRTGSTGSKDWDGVVH
jgi:hypothetical protein